MLTEFLHNIISPTTLGDTLDDDEVYEDECKPKNLDCYSIYTPNMSEFATSTYYHSTPPCRHSTTFRSSDKVKEKPSHHRHGNQKRKASQRTSSSSSTLTKSIAVITLAIMLFGGSGIQFATSQQYHPQNVNYSPHSVDSESISESLVDIDPLVSVPQDLESPHGHRDQESSPSFSLGSPTVRAISQRSSSDMSPNINSENGGGSDSSVPSQYGNCRRYDVCPSGDAWCSSLSENEKLALEAIHALHHQLDDDKNGNIDPFESNEFLREELKYDKGYEKRQENFHRNNDYQISVRELWEIWVRSEVHNWTVDQTVEWIGTFVGLESYMDKFVQLEINGTYLPRLAVNHHNFLSTNLGIKDVITRQRLTLKAQDVVLFGPPRDNTNRTKDAILYSLLVVAVTVCYLVYRRYKLSLEDLSRMSKDMEALVMAEETLHDLQKEMEQVKFDQEIREKEAVAQRGLADDDDELIRLREEVVVLRNELQRAELELQDKCWVPPPALTHWLQYTYEVESKSHSRKRQTTEKQLKQAKEACDKLKKKRSSLMGAFVATHARSIDDVDKAILEARSALTEVTQELQERMNRWKQIELLVKSPIVNNPGLASLEILLRAGSRAHPYLGGFGIGGGSGMTTSQDEMEDDASSIYCPSAVHKLISSSAFAMFPAPTTRSSDHSSSTNYGSCNDDIGDLSSEISKRDWEQHQYHNNSSQQQQRSSLPPYQTQCSSTTPSTYHPTESCGSHHFADCKNEVSGAMTNLNPLMPRSKSVQSVYSLRDPQSPRGMTREFSKDSCLYGDEEISMGSDAAEMTARDKRVTFRGSKTAQVRSLQGSRTASGLLPEFEENIRPNYVKRPSPMSPSSRLVESAKSSDEEALHQRKKHMKTDDPDLISHHTNANHNHHRNHGNNAVIQEEEFFDECTGNESEAETESRHIDRSPYMNYNRSHKRQSRYHHSTNTGGVVSEDEEETTSSNNTSSTATNHNNNMVSKDYPTKAISSVQNTQNIEVEVPLAAPPQKKKSIFKRISKFMKFSRHNSHSEQDTQQAGDKANNVNDLNGNGNGGNQNGSHCAGSNDDHNLQESSSKKGGKEQKKLKFFSRNTLSQ